MVVESLEAPKFHYDEDDDILSIVVKEGVEGEFSEVARGINLELNSAVRL